MINQTLQNRYKVTAQLGRGAMGLVYRATDRQTRQEVAVKVIARDLALDAELLARFRREGEALRQLRHRNIVAFVEMFAHEGQQVIVMEYVPGDNLHALIKRGPLPTPDAVRITLELCDALAQAHHIDIIHRDIKPENVLLTLEGVPKLTDFGIARLVGETTGLTHTGAMIGTPYYMSPEAWQGCPLDAQADVWSLGVMLYQMVSGRLPFAGDTLPVVMNKVLSETPPDLRALRPGTPEPLVRIIERMLVRDRAQRYETMRQVAVDLEQVQREARRAQEEETRLKAKAEQTAQKLEGRQETRPAQGMRLKAKQTEPQPPALVPKTTGTISRRTLALFGAGVLAMICLLAASGLGLWAAVGKFLAPASFTATATATRTFTVMATETSVPSTLTPAPSNIPLPSTATATSVPSTFTSSPTPETPTITPAPSLSIGSTVVSDKDGMPLLYVPAGEFLMGSTGADTDARSDEKPQHTVYLDAFWIDKTEVIQGMYAQCVTAGKCQKPKGASGGDNYPVIFVSWNDAKAYCEWAGRRLPTEAEWEKAARGTDGRKYPWGDKAPDPTLLYFDSDIAHALEGGQYPRGASPYGALDMAGNVWEWVADWYGESYYASSPKQNPAGPASGQYRIMRGGAWYFHPTYERAAFRGWDYPVNQSNHLGFRCSRSP